MPGSGVAFLGWLGIFTVVPFLIILGMSFLQKDPYGSILLEPTLKNYARCLQFIQVFGKTFWLALFATINCLLIGFPVAYFLARSSGTMRQVGLVLLFIPFWTNFVLRMHAVVSLLGNQGLINQVLLKTGMIDEPLTILYTRTGVYIGLIYNYLPFLVVPIYSALEKLDGSLREAAQDLGAGRAATLFKVVIPNVKEGIFVGSLFVFIPMLGEYVIPDLLGGAKEAFLGNIMVSQFFTMQDWPFGSAIAGLLSVLLLVALWLQTRVATRRGMVLH